MTLNEPGPPDAANGGDEAGSTDIVHVGAGGGAASWLIACDALADPLVTVIVALRASVVVFAAAVNET